MLKGEDELVQKKIGREGRIPQLSGRRIRRSAYLGVT